jgi:hypothetical protein
VETKTLEARNVTVVVENDELEIANPQFALALNKAIESIRKISSLEIDQLFCYHGGVVEEDVKKEIDETTKQVSRTAKLY